MSLPSRVSIVEVGPRDGLQNETHCLSIEQKQTLIKGLVDSGHQHVECGSFVSAKRVPQMANTAELFQTLPTRPCTFSALVPNLRGAEMAIASGVKQLAVFTAASSAFTQKNQGCDQNTTLKHIQQVIDLANRHQIPVRAYISCVVGCPYTGSIEPQATADLTDILFEMGCYQISLGDTTGVATPKCIENLLNCIGRHHGMDKLAGHFHNTLGQALANTLQALQMGVRVFDSSIAGLGGCPFAGGDNGNLATEDLVYMLDKMGIETGLNLMSLIETGHAVSQWLSRPNRSMVGRNLRLPSTCQLS